MPPKEALTPFISKVVNEEGVSADVFVPYYEGDGGLYVGVKPTNSRGEGRTFTLYRPSPDNEGLQTVASKYKAEKVKIEGQNINLFTLKRTEIRRLTGKDPQSIEFLFKPQDGAESFLLLHASRIEELNVRSKRKPEEKEIYPNKKRTKLEQPLTTEEESGKGLQVTIVNPEGIFRKVNEAKPFSKVSPVTLGEVTFDEGLVTGVTVKLETRPYVNAAKPGITINIDTDYFSKLNLNDLEDTTDLDRRLIEMFGWLNDFYDPIGRENRININNKKNLFEAEDIKDIKIKGFEAEAIKAKGKKGAEFLVMLGGKKDKNLNGINIYILNEKFSSEDKPFFNTEDLEEIIRKAIEHIGGIEGISYDKELILKLPGEKVADLLPEMIIKNTGVKLSDIGGNKEAKNEIVGIVRALRNERIYKSWGAELPKGILLHGPPGTGKTLLASALATEAGLRFLNIKSSDLLSKWYGKSEQNLENFLKKANEEPTIVFIDEIDSLLAKRSSGDNPQKELYEASKRVVSLFLQAMDGINSYKNIIFVGATNQLGALDEAAARPGRFSRWIEVPLPNAEELEEILKIHISNKQEALGEVFAENIYYNSIIPELKGLSGAAIKEIIRIALGEKALIHCESGIRPEPVDTKNLQDAITKYKKGRTEEEPKSEYWNMFG